MRRGTTPTITARIGADLSDMTIYLAFCAGNHVLVKTGADLDVAIADGVTTVETTLSQADTLDMPGRECLVQVRAVTEHGATALATDIGTIPLEPILQGGVLDG